jgi:hypothetical protein
MPKISPEEAVSLIAFVCDEFETMTIESGPLKGEFNPSLAIAKMLEIRAVLMDTEGYPFKS